MPKPAIEVISGYVTAPSTTLTSLTMNGNDSLTVKSTKGMAYIASVFSKNQAAGRVEIHSPRMHDNNHGWNYDVVTGNPEEYWPDGAMEQVFSQDNLIVQQSGSATSGDLEETGLILYYSDPGGIDQRLIHYREAFRRKQRMVTTRHSITGGSSGGYSGEVAISGGSVYELKANRDYALVGYAVNTSVFAVVVKGNDTGNVRVGGPGNAADKRKTGSFFLRKSRINGIPFIPVINSANGGNTTVGVACDENGGTFVIELFWFLLD